MSYEFDPILWEPQRRTLEEVIYELNEGVNRIVLQSPTGTGKTMLAQELFRWSDHNGSGGNFYVNRKILIGQTYNRFKEAGIWVGARAAEYDEEYDEDAPFQVSSSQSEDARVYKSGQWELHHVGEGGLVIIDEAHLQKTGVMKKILSWYDRQGARVILLTATPVNMKGWAEKIIISGKLAEWRDCGALVPIYTHTISQPDLRKVKKNAEGEYVLTPDKKKKFVQSIVGEVVSSYEQLHEGGPTFCYCPGVPESVWMAEQFQKRGHRFIHIDATNAIIDGEKRKLDRDLWSDIVSQMKDGTAAGVTCRFKAREGIDIPSATHGILATPVGSLSSFLQICGRIMRAAPGKDRAIMQDHGGVFHQHGSPNSDRDWESLWQLKEHAASSLHMDMVKEGMKKEPIRCPKCGMERSFGPKCPNPKCGFEHQQSVRLIREEEGTLREVKGDLVKQTRRQTRHDTERKWTQMYYGFKNKRVERSFAQMEAYFYREHGYRPSRDLPFMPRRIIDWKKKVYEIPMSDLIGTHKGKVSE